MRPPTERAAFYRVRAEELRTMSDEWVEPATRVMLNRVATDYERMADQLDSLQDLDRRDQAGVA